MSNKKNMKDKAQDALDDLRLKTVPLGVYKHWKGALYVVYGLTVHEETLEVLVHYYSCLQHTRWTRTLHNFTEDVENGRRFLFQRDATVAELLEAAGYVE